MTFPSPSESSITFEELPTREDGLMAQITEIDVALIDPVERMPSAPLEGALPVRVDHVAEDEVQ